MSSGRQRNARWAKLVEEFERGNLTRDAFAKKHRVKPSTFHYWLYKIRQQRRDGKGSVKRPAFVEVDVKQDHQEAAVRLELPGGAALVFERPPSADFLAEMLKALS